MNMPEELLQTPRPQLAVVVAYHRPAGHPWAYYTALVVVLDKELHI